MQWLSHWAFAYLSLASTYVSLVSIGFVLFVSSHCFAQRTNASRRGRRPRLPAVCSSPEIFRNSNFPNEPEHDGKAKWQKLHFCETWVKHLKCDCSVAYGFGKHDAKG